MRSHYDAIVVGLGGVGSFALRALSKETGGGRYLGIEVGSLAHSVKEEEVDSSSIRHEDFKAGFSSRGYTRIYRRAYFEHVNYIPWIEYSLDVFREMEASSGSSLMKECGVLLIEPTLSSQGSKSTRELLKKDRLLTQLPPLVTASMNSAHIHGVSVKLLHMEQLKKQFPQFKYGDDDMVGLLEPGGGLLRPEKIMRVALNEAMSCTNVDVVDRTRVSIIKDFVEQGIVELQLSQRNKSKGAIKVTTNKLLVCVGAWTGALIPTWDGFLHPVRQVQGWINTNEGRSKQFPNIFSCDNMPSFLYISPHWPEALYGVPCDNSIENNVSGSRGSWLKVGIHKQDISKSKHLSIDDHPSYIASSDEILELQRVIPLCISESAWDSNEYPTAIKQVPLVEAQPCLYTMTTDKHFVIGEKSKNIFGVAGLSGHGFKMTPSLGQMMADFACGRDVNTIWKSDFCSPKRFENHAY